MDYKVSFEQANKIFDKLWDKYDIYAPKRFEGRGRYSDTDIVRYDKVNTVEEIVFDEKSDFPAKEILAPISQTLFYFTEDEYRESKCSNRPILIFMRPCDINAMHHQEKIYLGNGGYTDLYYERMNERVKIVMMECTEGWDTCFCVSMGANKAEDYAVAVRCENGNLLADIKDSDLDAYFAEAPAADFKPDYIEKNEIELQIPEIPNREVLAKLKAHPMWEEYNKRCISCGSCTVACSTCTCFTTMDIIYHENGEAGERKRTTASCQIKGFADMAGGHTFRTTAAERMRYKVLHKFHDYKARFKDYHMCVGCGRCTTRCPEFISITATVNKMSKAIDEIIAAENN